MKIEERIKFLEDKLWYRLKSIRSYSDLSENEKYPLRVDMAEIDSLKNFVSHEHLDKILELCIKNEYFEYCEGIKRTKKYLNEKQLA